MHNRSTEVRTYRDREGQAQGERRGLAHQALDQSAQTGFTCVFGELWATPTPYKAQSKRVLIIQIADISINTLSTIITFISLIVLRLQQTAFPADAPGRS